MIDSPLVLPRMPAPNEGLLRDADPAWVANLHRGVRMLFLQGCLCLLFGAGALVLVIVMAVQTTYVHPPEHTKVPAVPVAPISPPAHTQVPGISATSTPHSMAIVVIHAQGWGGTMQMATMSLNWTITVDILLTVLFVLGLVGVVRLTSAEPGASGRHNSATWRMAILITMVLACVGPMLLPDGDGGLGPGLAIAANALMLTGLVAVEGVFVYLQHLAARLPDHALARHTRVVMRGSITSVGVFLINALGYNIIFYQATIHSPVPGWALNLSPTVFYVYLGVACMAVQAMVVFGLWYLLLLFRYSRAFRVAAKQAAQNATAP